MEFRAVARRALVPPAINSTVQQEAAATSLPVRDIAIHTEKLGTKHLLGHQTERERYLAIRDVLAPSVRNALRRT
jgi:hypothetical protein